MKPYKMIFSAAGVKSLLAMFLIVLSVNMVFGGNRPTCKETFLVSKISDSNDWKVFATKDGISIFYTDIKGLSCKGYLLKIVNDNKESRVIDFAVGGKLSEECRPLYSSFLNFQYRKMTINPGETLIGSEKLSSLLIPNGANSSLQELLQNFNIQPSGK